MSLQSAGFVDEYGITTKGIVAIIVSVLALLVIVITFFSSLRFIDTGKVGVVTNYGRVTGRELEEGANFVLPWGINSVTPYDVKTQKESANVAAATKDLQDVSAELVLNYRLNRGDVSRMHQTVGDDYKDKLITPALSETFKAASAKYSATEIVSNRPALKKEVVTTLEDRLKSYGITIQDVSLTNFQYSPSFAKAIEDKQVAQQNAERAKFNLEAAKTDAQAQKVQSETLSAEYLKKLAIEKWNGEVPKYLGGNGLFGINFKE